MTTALTNEAAETTRRTFGGDKPSPVVTAAKTEKLYDLIVKSSGITGVSRLTVSELAAKSGMPESTVRRHLKLLIEEKRIERVAGQQMKAAESDGERALRRVGGIPGKSYFQPAFTAPTANNAVAVEWVRAERRRLVRRAARRATRKEAALEHANRVAGAVAA